VALLGCQAKNKLLEGTNSLGFQRSCVESYVQRVCTEQYFFLCLQQKKSKEKKVEKGYEKLYF
jgi:hypothetical protein